MTTIVPVEPTQVQESLVFVEKDHFSEAFNLYQKNVDTYNNFAESSTKSSQELFGRAKELEVKLAMSEEALIAQGIKNNDELEALNKRLDVLATKTNELSGKIAEEETRKLNLNAEFVLVQQKQEEIMSNFRSFKLTQEQTGLEGQYRAIRARKDEVSERMTSTGKSFETLNNDVEKTEKELAELNRRFMGHGHTFTYSGSCIQRGTNGPSYSSPPDPNAQVATQVASGKQNCTIQ